MALSLILRSQNTQLSGLRHVSAALNPAAASRVAATAIADTVRHHLRDLERTHPNKQGWKRQNWWSKAADSVRTEPRLGQTTAVIINEPGVALHRYGGTVHPVRSRFLTIPVSEKAYGHRAKEFQGLFRVRLHGRTFLARNIRERIAPRSRKFADKLEPLFLLATKTEHKADPDVLPTDAQLDRAGTHAVAAALADTVRSRRLGQA